MFLRTLFISALLAAALQAKATIIGLNQIITPDLQPKGMLATSVQIQDPAIGNEAELQFELGLTDWLEAAVFQGVRPGEAIFSAEGSLWKQGPQLLSVGLINLSTRHYGPQPVVEYGYYETKDQFSVGAIDANRTAEAVLGYRHIFSDSLQFSADFQSGRENFSTVGFTYNFTPAFSVNPAVYFPNSGRHIPRAYIVFTWSTALWK
jgi:hypothetical protein